MGFGSPIRRNLLLKEIARTRATGVPNIYIYTDPISEPLQAAYTVPNTCTGRRLGDDQHDWQAAPPRNNKRSFKPFFMFRKQKKKLVGPLLTIFGKDDRSGPVRPSVRCMHSWVCLRFSYAPMKSQTGLFGKSSKNRSFWKRPVFQVFPKKRRLKQSLYFLSLRSVLVC